MAKRGVPCSVCALKEDRTRLESLRLSGVSLDALARKFNVHRDAIWRHMRNHLSPELRASYLAGETTIAELRERAAKENLSVLDYLSIGRSMIVGAMTASAEAGDGFRLATLSGRLVEILREIGRITGEVDKLGGGVTINNQISILSDPRMVDLQTGLVRIAREVPDARTPILSLLRDLDARPAAPRAAPMIVCEATDAA